MRKKLITIAAIGLGAVLSVSAQSRDMRDFIRDVAVDSEVKKIEFDSDIDLADLRIETHKGGDIFNCRARYDADRVKIDVDYDKSGKTADIFLSSDHYRQKLSVDSDDNEMRISMSRDYVWDINLDMGFAESRVDLTGLPLENLSLDIGASECRIKFEEPNSEVLRSFNIDAGAGELKIFGIGYSNFEHFEFDGGAGEFLLNFKGLGEGFHSANIDVGVGEVRIELPRDYPIRIESGDGWLNSVEIRGGRLYEVDDGVYETKDYEEAEYGLEISLDLGIGEATISVVE